jgi:hypothetical protein
MASCNEFGGESYQKGTGRLPLTPPVEEALIGENILPLLLLLAIGQPLGGLRQFT